MNSRARRALEAIRECVAEHRYLVLPHFVQRLDQRGYCWPDVLLVLHEPTDVRSDGIDEFDRAKWILTGTTFDGVSLEVVCVLDADERGRLTVFITLY